MGLSAMIKSLFLSQVESTLLRQTGIWPAANAGVNMISDNAAVANAYRANYGEVVAAAVIANPSWLIGISLGVPIVEAIRGDIKIATGAAGVEVDIATFPIGTNTFPVAEWSFPVFRLTKPIKIIGAPRIAWNIRKDTGASLSGFANCHVLMATAIG